MIQRTSDHNIQVSEGEALDHNQTSLEQTNSPVMSNVSDPFNTYNPEGDNSYNNYNNTDTVSSSPSNHHHTRPTTNTKSLRQHTVTRSGRISRPPKRFDYQYVYESLLQSEEYSNYEVYGASNDPDILYYHEILQEPDCHKFIEAMDKEISQHNEWKNWKLVPRINVPRLLRVLPSVWAMRRKRDLTTGVITKWKVRINVYGSKQQYGIDYDETYALVASWASIWLILLISCLNNWVRRQIDYVQAFPQAPIEQELYIEIPKGCNIGKYDPKDWVLQVLNNIYGQCQAGKVWFDYLTKGLVDKLGFKQSKIDPCILWRNTTIMILYTDDTIITGPNEKVAEHTIKDIATLYDITTNDEVSDFLGVHIETNNETGEIH
jgi:Reverse transcriptase (RNA-dependent DNA polymerase)